MEKEKGTKEWNGQILHISGSIISTSTKKILLMFGWDLEEEEEKQGEWGRKKIQKEKKQQNTHL